MRERIAVAGDFWEKWLVEIYHLFPKEELELHEATQECLCEPEMVKGERLDNCVLAGETTFEHQAFSPLGNGTGDYKVVKEVSQ